MNITTCCLCLETCRCSDSDTDSDLEVIYERNARVLDVASVPEVIHECKGITNGARTINIGEALFVKEDATSKSHHKATLLKIMDERHILIEWEWKKFTPDNTEVVQLDWVLPDERERQQRSSYNEDDIVVYVPPDFHESGWYFPL